MEVRGLLPVEEREEERALEEVSVKEWALVEAKGNLMEPVLWVRVREPVEGLVNVLPSVNKSKMPRPRLCRRVLFRPNVTYFKPQGIPLRDIEIVELSSEEIEAFKLRHVDKMEQTDGAVKMNTSQSTYQRILYSAYEKIADALVNGKGLLLEEHRGN